MQRVHRPTGRLVLLTVFLVVGCEANHYDIEMRPAGKTVQRELVCWRAQTAREETELLTFPEDELRRIAAEYSAPVPDEKKKKHRFSGVFADQLPQDVGGSGSYTHWDTPLGSTSAYIERFRGNDDLAATVEMRQKAAERLGDLLIPWLASKLEGEPGFENLHKFLETGLRQDLKALSLYGWLFEVASVHENAVAHEFLVRMGQYLVERSYFTIDQLPRVLRAWEEVEHEGGDQLVALVQRFVASKMGIPEDQPPPACLRFLSSESVLKDSLNDYLRGTDDYGQALEEWEREKAVNGKANKPEPIDVLGSLVSQAYLPNFGLRPRDQLGVALAVTHQPFLTNGHWDEQSEQVTWSRPIPAEGSNLGEFPTLLYAFWSAPDRRAQTARFGKVILQDEALAKYCLWYRGLSDSQAAQWNNFIGQLSPGAEAVERIGTFRFSDDEGIDNGQDYRDHADTARDLILRALAK